MFERFLDAGDLLDQGACSPDELAQLSQRFQAAMARRDAEDALQVATRLMLRRQHGDAIQAFTTIAESSPDRRGHCANNIGACYFGLQRYEEAIQWYEHARQHGADPRMVDDNVQEARQMLGRSGASSAPPAPSPHRPVRDYAEVLLRAATPHVGKRVHVAGAIPMTKHAALRAIAPEPARILVVLDLTTFGSGKDAAVFTEDSVIIKDMDTTRRVHLGDIVGSDGPQGFTQAEVAAITRSGTTITLPCGDHAEAMDAILRAVGSHNR